MLLHAQPGNSDRCRDIRKSYIRSGGRYHGVGTVECSVVVVSRQFEDQIRLEKLAVPEGRAAAELESAMGMLGSARKIAVADGGSLPKDVAMMPVAAGA